MLGGAPEVGAQTAALGGDEAVRGALRPGERRTENGEQNARQARDGRGRWEGVGGLPCGTDTKDHEEQGALTRPGERRTERAVAKRQTFHGHGEQNAPAGDGRSGEPGLFGLIAAKGGSPGSTSKLPSFQLHLHPRHVCDVPEGQRGRTYRTYRTYRTTADAACTAASSSCACRALSVLGSLFSVLQGAPAPSLARCGVVWYDCVK